MAQLFSSDSDYKKTIRRGDIVLSGYNGYQIYNGKNFNNLECNESVGFFRESYIPSKFTIEEFTPTYWHNTLCNFEHNRDIIWFTPSLYNYSNPQIISPTTVIISNKHNKYPIYLIYSNSFKTKTYKYLIEVLQKITIPVACENGYSIKSNNLNSIVIFNNYIVTNKYEIIKLKSIEKLIKHAIDHNWRDIIIKHIYKLKLHKKHINTHTFDLCLYHTKLTTNIHVKLFDKNLFN
jgi:hypothetical protein